MDPGFWSFLRRLPKATLPLIVLISLAHIAQADVVDDYIRERMAREHIPGLSLVVMRDGKIVKSRAYGYANLEWNVSATPTTVYDLASTTKPFVATAVLLLVQDGKLSLDDPIGKFLDSVPEAWKKITLRQLLSHTSGIQDYLRDLRKDFPSETPPEEIVKAVAEMPLSFTPGEKWSYSNTGYIVLGMIVAKVGGKRYDQILSERVFGPAGMTQTGRHTADGVVKERANGYFWYGGRFLNFDFLRYMMADHGDRGLVSTALDLAKWESVLAGTTVLTEQTKRLMWSPVIRFNDGYSYDFEYGLGWFIKTINGHRQISHPGGAPGTAAIFSRYPDDKLTVILLANSNTAFIQALELGIARHYLPGLMAAKAVTLTPKQLEECTGYYNAYGTRVIKVTRDRNGLSLDDGGGLNNTFVPVSETRFVCEEADRAFTIVRGSAGGNVQATVRFGNGDVPLQFIGPLAKAMSPQDDPDAALSNKIKQGLMALGEGGQAKDSAPQIAPQTRKEFWQSEPGLAGIERLSFLAARNVADQGIERHGSKVQRVLYYRVYTRTATRYVLVYLTADNLIADEDLIDD